MRRGAMVLAVLLVGLWVGNAVADNTPPPGYQAAFDKCKAQGLTPGTNDFNKCIAGLFGAPTGGTPPTKPSTTTGSGGGQPPQKPADGTPPSGGGGQQPTSAAGIAAQSCIAQGLKPNTTALNLCVVRALLPAAQQSAWDSCIAKGLTPQTDGFVSCMGSSLQSGSKGPALTARQQDDVDYCLGKGLKAGSADFKSCIATAGKAKLPANAQAAVDSCQGQGLTDPGALAKCVSALLTVKIPSPAGKSSGPKPADVQAAFDACFDAGKKAGTANFQACVKKSLSS